MYVKHVPFGNGNNLTLVSSQFTRTHLKKQAEKFKKEEDEATLRANGLILKNHGSEQSDSVEIQGKGFSMSHLSNRGKESHSLRPQSEKPVSVMEASKSYHEESADVVIRTDYQSRQ